MQELTGESIGRYHIMERLGEGGMAVVYRAYDTRLECDVAIKFIRTEKLSSENAALTLKRFKNEAQKTAALLHPNIVPVTDYGEFKGIPFLVMKYLPGGTLKKALLERLQTGQGPYPYQQAAALLVPIARALEEAHRKGLVHRDIKPSNILLTPGGQPMLSDFGVAKVLESNDTMDHTALGVGIGTPEYMAPEQWEAKPLDGRADVYALGVVFYELITGRVPFKAETIPAVMVKVLRDALPRPRDFVKDIPENVEKIIFKALAKQPENRYDNMSDFALILEKLISIQANVGAFHKSTTNGTHFGSYQSTKLDLDNSKNRRNNSPKSKRIRKPIDWQWWLFGGVISSILILGPLFILFHDQSTKLKELLTGFNQSTTTAVSLVSATEQSKKSTTSSIATATQVDLPPVVTVTPTTIRVSDLFSTLGAEERKTADLPTTLALTLGKTVVTYEQNFEMESMEGWLIGENARIDSGYLSIYGNKEWTSTIRKAPNYLQDNEGILLQFSCSQNANAEIFLDSGEWETSGYRRWGIYCDQTPDMITLDSYYDKDVTVEGEYSGTLKFQPNNWYNLLLVVSGNNKFTGTNQFIGRVWDVNRPEQYLSINKTMGAEWGSKNWDFHVGAYAGSIMIDNYQEIKLVDTP